MTLFHFTGAIWAKGILSKLEIDYDTLYREHYMSRRRVHYCCCSIESWSAASDLIIWMSNYNKKSYIYSIIDAYTRLKDHCIMRTETLT